MFIGARYSDGTIELFRVELLRIIRYAPQTGELLVHWVDGSFDRRSGVTRLTLFDQLEEGLQ